jgi:hypothetical protein
MGNELYHHGVKGMKWGVRKLDERNGDLYLRKGTAVKRVSRDTQDRVWNNRKYVSINQEDHAKWDDYLGRLYLTRGYLTTTHSYKTVKDLKVMSSTKQGELYTKMLMDSDFKKQAVNDLNAYYEAMPQMKRTNNPSEEISRIMSASSLWTGKAFADEVLKRGYDAVIDTHGQNTAKTPLIILNADTNLKKIDVDYTDKAKEYLREAHGIAA